MIGPRAIGSAFTLIELLVVIAAISLLLAVMLPALHAARKLTYGIVCKSNLRQIAFAWNAYLADNGQRFYRDVDANHDFGGWKGRGGGAFHRPLNKYLGLPTALKTDRDAKIFRCSADGGDQDYGPMAYRYYGNSYQTNLMLVGPDALPGVNGLPEPIVTLNREINGYLKNLRADTVRDSALLLLVGDNNWVTQWDPLIPLGAGGRSWHGRDEHYNLAFLDGHVGFVNIRKSIYIDPDFEYRIQPFGELDDITFAMQSRIVSEVVGED